MGRTFESGWRKKVFAHTAGYDAAIAGWFAAQRGERFPEDITLHARRAQPLRYGENPEQQAAFYAENGAGGISALKQLGGKELSFNNLLDLEGALLATEPFGAETCCAIVKHTTPCGIAVGASAQEAYHKALACDPVSAFGSVIAFTVPVDREAAEAISSLFVECIVAPSFADEAVEILGRKKNLRVLAGAASWSRDALDVKRGARRVPGPGAHSTDHGRNNMAVVTERAPTDAERQNLCVRGGAPWASVKVQCHCPHARPGDDWVSEPGRCREWDAAFIAVHKARAAGHETRGKRRWGQMRSSRFASGVEQAAEAGLHQVIQAVADRCGTRSDRAANERGMAMVFTGEAVFGIRGWLAGAGCWLLVASNWVLVAGALSWPAPAPATRTMDAS
jgi:phosphoribosylaminoimidazolecarboxamide formyltransferase/IMP cyclohydrolase